MKNYKKAIEHATKLVKDSINGSDNRNETASSIRNLKAILHHIFPEESILTDTWNASMWEKLKDNYDFK